MKQATVSFLVLAVLQVTSGFQLHICHNSIAISRQSITLQHERITGDRQVLHASKHESEADEVTAITNVHDRRDAIRRITSSAVATTALTFAGTGYLHPEAVAAATTDSKLLDEKAKLFKQVPVFALVSDAGVPFMILQNTGAGVAYFFTSYEGAKLVLDDARRDAAEKDLETQRMWNDAKISAVPLEFALKLQKGRPRATAQNNNKYDTVYDLIASVTAFDDAGKIDKSGFFNERGRVPIFYSDDFKIKPAVEGGEKRYPVFFQKDDLVNEYNKKYPEAAPPRIEVADLIDTFNAMTNSAMGGSKSSSDRSMNENIFLFPSATARKMASECEKSRGTVPAYRTGEMIAVGGK